MRILTALLGLFFFSISPSAQELDLTDPKQKASYAFGLASAVNMKVQFGESLDVEAVAQGLLDGYADKAKLSPEEAQATVQAFVQDMRSRQQAAKQEADAERLLESRAWLGEIAQEEGIRRTESGLLYRIVKRGDGDIPTDTDRVTVHYLGQVKDGTQFDSSYDRGEPATFPVNGVISGWTEALQLMPVGSIYELYIPSDLAYGNSDRSDVIKANSALYFKVELLAIN